MNLFIDTANTDLVIAITTDEEVLYLSDEANDTNLSIKLVPAIKKALDSVKIKVNDIKTIFIVDGPGSFTGTRMGVTVAKTYAWALKKKIIPISELEVMASTPFEGDYLLALIDARHNAVYGALYDTLHQVVINGCYTPLDALIKVLPTNKEVVIVSRDKFDLPYPIIEPKKDIIAIIKRHMNDEGINPHVLNPNYLKKTEAEEKLHKEE